MRPAARVPARESAMKAAELYKLLDAELGPALREHGFRKRRSSRLAFQRSVAGRYQTISFQADKWGWDQYAGSSFFVTFSVSPSPDPDDAARREERLNHFLTDAELAQARDYRDSVVAHIPRPPAAHFATLEEQFHKSAPGTAAQMIAALRAEFEPASEPYRRNQDFGLRYWTPADIAGWASFVRVVLPRALEAMESW